MPGHQRRECTEQLFHLRLTDNGRNTGKSHGRSGFQTKIPVREKTGNLGILPQNREFDLLKL